MNRTVVSSSRIYSVGWENNTLEIQFHNGAIYQYHGVSETEYHNFMNSPSLGCFAFARNTYICMYYLDSIQ